MSVAPPGREAPAAANGIVFLPGFDGMAELRAPFVQALAERHPARCIGYPNRTMQSLNGYARFAAAEAGSESRPVVVAESFSGLVAARWAARDPHVAALVLCAGFAKAPMGLAKIGASMPGVAQFLGANFLTALTLGSNDPERRRWSESLSAAIRALDPGVVAERLRIIATDDVSAELAGLRIPLIVVHFDDDLVIGGEARAHLESVCHNAQVVKVKGPHFAIEVRPRESAQALLPHITRLFG